MATLKISKIFPIYFIDNVYTRWQKSKIQFGYSDDAAFASFLLDSVDSNRTSKNVIIIKKESTGVCANDGLPYSKGVKLTTLKLVKPDTCNKSIQTDVQSVNVRLHLQPVEIDLPPKSPRVSGFENENQRTKQLLVKTEPDNDNDNYITAGIQMECKSIEDAYGEINNEFECADNVPTTDLNSTIIRNRQRLRQTICNECVPPVTLARSSNLRRHITLFHEMCKCEQCGEEFVGWRIYREHVRAAHSVGRRLRKARQKLQCEHCLEMYQDKYRLSLHKFKYHGEGEAFPCSQCCSKFLSKNELEKHVEKTHTLKTTAQSRYKYAIPRHCQFCNEIFYNKKSMTKHVKHAHKQFSFVTCNICDKRLSSEASLYIHKQCQHSSTRASYSCPLCGKTFQTLCGRKVHYETEHDNIRYKCAMEGCGLLYTSRNTLRVHIASAHLKDDIPIADQHVCPQCGKRFVHDQLLKRHMKSHDPHAYSCPCGKSFQQPSRLRSHIAVSHNKVKNFVCHLCSKAFGSNTHLTRHVTQVHNKLK